MIKILIPQDKTKEKTNIRGLWRNDEGKLFYDYLKVENFYYNKNYVLLENIQKAKAQEAIFFIDCESNTANIFYSRDKIEVLKHKISYSCTIKPLKSVLKKALHDFGGCTVYKQGKGYLVEAWIK
jgi:hypothetical protein